MLQKFNITAYAVVLCLFGFMLFSAAPVFANYDYGYGDMDVACKAIKDGSSTDDQIDECFTDIWDRASLSTYDSLVDEHNSEIQQLKDELAEAIERAQEVNISCAVSEEVLFFVGEASGNDYNVMMQLDETITNFCSN